MDKRSPSGEESSRDREEAIDRILEHLKEHLHDTFDDEAPTLDEIEDQSESIGEYLKHVINEEVLKKRQHRDEQQSRSASCGCGCAARYVGRRWRQLVLLSGVVRVWRSYYVCRVCHRGFAPLDQSLGVGWGQCSRRVAALVGRLSCYLPDRLVVQELIELHGIFLAVSTVQRYSRRIGAAIQRTCQSDQAKMQKRSLPASGERPQRLHVTADGVMVHVGGGWREAKLGSVYQTSPSGQAVKARYYATMERSAPFGRQLRLLAHRSGSDHCRDIAGVADGAAWIWQEIGKHFPQSVQVLDYYHVIEHLWEAAHLRFGEGSAQASQWMKQQKARLLDNEVDQVIASVAEWRPRKLEKHTVRRRLLGYLSGHRQRMLYKTFLEAGYHIGSGVAESGCKNVVQIRMKRAGMRWSEQGAEPMLHLCSWYASHDRGTLDQYLKA
jgi:hypothetical protein